MKKSKTVAVFVSLFGIVAYAVGSNALAQVVEGQAVDANGAPQYIVDPFWPKPLPTSEFVCDTGGMIVICAGTTGYNVTLDLRYHWMRQKRFQGSHLSNDEQAAAVNRLVIDGKIDPCLSEVFDFDDLGHAHQLMHENRHAAGQMAVLVNATERGQGAS